jgi:hypothetical protein
MSDQSSRGATAVRSHDGGGSVVARDHEDFETSRGSQLGGVAHDRDTSGNATQRADQVRWGPVWAGLALVLPVFLLGELIFLALGVFDLGDSVSGPVAGIITGLIALVAFFVGGLVAGATAMWKGVDTGLLHGILVWALGITAVVLLTLLGAGSLLGTFGTAASQLIDPATISGAAASANAPSQQEVAAAGQSAASAGVLGLGLTIIAAALGGVVGSKMWPRGKKGARAQQ